MIYLGAQKVAMSRDSIFLRWKYWEKYTPSLIEVWLRQMKLDEFIKRLASSEILNITSSEILKQMPFFFHSAEALTIHPIVSLPPNGLRIFKKWRERRVQSAPSFFSLRLTYHLQLIGAGFSEALDLHRQNTFTLCFPTTHQTPSVSKPPCLGSGGVQRRVEKVDLVREERKISKWPLNATTYCTILLSSKKNYF